MKKFHVIIAMQLLLLVIQANPNTRQTINIASEPDYPPFCLVDEKGNAAGFSIELFRAAADAAGLRVNVRIGVWNQIKRDLISGRIDALPLVGRTPEREELFDFTIPYISLRGAVFVRRGTSAIHSLQDLKGREIAVMKGDNAEEFIRREGVSEKILTTNTFEEAFRELAAGRCDAVITQRVMGIRLLEAKKIKSVIPLDLQLPQFRQDFCFAVREGNRELLALLNEGLSIIIANDTYQKIRDRWFRPVIKERYALKDILIIALYILIPAAILSTVFWIAVLRREVRRRTRYLNELVAKHANTLESLRKQKLLLNEMERASKIGGWEYDAESGNTIWTEGTYDVYGVSKSGFDPLSYNRYISFYRLADQKKLDRVFRRILETGGSFNLVLRLNPPDGSGKWIRTRGQAEMINGKVKRVFGNIMDITEQIQAETELKEMKNELEGQVRERTAELRKKIGKLDRSQKAMIYMVEDLNRITGELKEERRKLNLSNRELEAFTYSVSHDLRAPLRAVDGFSRFLQEDYSGKLDGEGKRLIQTIRNSAVKMDRLITDLLELSRISRRDMHLGDVDMKEVVESVYHETANENQLKAFSISIEKMPAVKCDAQLIKQVWKNLIENALKYSSKSKTKRIEVGSRIDGGSIVFFIKDRGAGFDERYKDKLFGVFQRLHKEDEFRGTGVGLAIVQRIIHRQGGAVWAEGAINKGAAFYFTLPRKTGKLPEREDENAE